MNKPAHDVAPRYLPPSRQNAPVDSALVAHLPENALRVLRIKQLIERTNLSRATLYGLMSNDPTFPRKIKLTARSIGFLESEVDAWIHSRAQLRGAM
ncbi:helix-turn-helix transcriptional regulator [Burkholderia gladioli]|uniref:helix-turn-helix transcriptional regulator n=1 Tax=Burkholderia gladioli TaxID=28095 RepID=UPI003D1A2CC8